MPFSIRSRNAQIKSNVSSAIRWFVLSFSERKKKKKTSKTFLTPRILYIYSKDDSEEESSEATEPKFPIRTCEYVEGRNYRKSKKPSEQFLPCDDEELERLQVNHLLFK